MKLLKVCLMMMAASWMLIGCTNKSSICYPGKRCNEYQIYNRCGSSLRYECEDICKLCNVNEPSCYSCRACLETDPEACLTSLKYGGRCGN